MTSILITFLVALCLSLALTPLAGLLGVRFGAIDLPDQRKIHSVPTPRTGGIGIFTASYASLLLISQVTTDITVLLDLCPRNLFLMTGSLLVFAMGLFDDFISLGPRVKFMFQLLAAVMPCLGGVRISYITIDHLALQYFLNCGLTVFWFLLLMNAVNLIDGMDGLAGGIVFFACLLMIIMSTLGQRYESALLFAAIGGAVLGFLRYNFNPATIFLGDCGSYFLGYVIAGVSILGSSKSQLSAAILIPIISLGVPLFDTLFSPLRRFIRGKKLFYPDKEHLHHRLLKMGLKTRHCVMLIYGVTVLLCIAAVVAVNLRDEQAGLFLLILGIVCFFTVRKLGYFDYIASRRILSWVRDVSEETGFSRFRRSFLDLQMKIEESGSHEELWKNIVKAIETLDFDKTELHLYKKYKKLEIVTGSHKTRNVPGQDNEDCLCPLHGVDTERRFYWKNRAYESSGIVCRSCLMKIELPLIRLCPQQIFGILWLEKDLNRNPVTHYTLRRVEHLRRTIISSLANLNDGIKSLKTTYQSHTKPLKYVFKILLADGDRSVLERLTREFRDGGFEVITAADGRTALKLIQDNAVDGALLDVSLREISGIELCSEIKFLHPNTQIVAFTGTPTMTESQLCLDVGFDGYFPKSVGFHLMVKHFQKTLHSVKFNNLEN